MIKNETIMKIVGATIVISIVVTGVYAIVGQNQKSSERQERVRTSVVKKDIAWCVNVCMEDIFDDMHSRGESWGTGSSSMSGMMQENTLVTVKNYCESVYESGCYKVHYSSDLGIHSSYAWKSANSDGGVR